MIAVIKTGGKQYTIKEGEIFKVEKLDVEAGSSYTFKEVLLLTDDKKITVGSPFVKGAGVEVEILSQGKGDKVFIFKKKRRKDYRKRQGHRQLFTQVKVTKIIAA